MPISNSQFPLPGSLPPTVLRLDPGATRVWPSRPRFMLASLPSLQPANHTPCCGNPRAVGTPLDLQPSRRKAVGSKERSLPGPVFPTESGYRYSTVQYGTVRYGTVLYCMVPLPGGRRRASRRSSTEKGETRDNAKASPASYAMGDPSIVPYVEYPDRQHSGRSCTRPYLTVVRDWGSSGDGGGGDMSSSMTAMALPPNDLWMLRASRNQQTQWPR